MDEKLIAGCHGLHQRGLDALAATLLVLAESEAASDVGPDDP